MMMMMMTEGWTDWEHCLKHCKNICFHIGCTHFVENCTQNHTLSCLSDVIGYFVSKAGPQARPLNIDQTTLQGLSPMPAPGTPAPGTPLAGTPVAGASAAAGAPSPRLYSGAATVSPRTRSSSTSAAFSQFVYGNSAVAGAMGSVSKQSEEVASLSHESPSAVSGVGGTVASSSPAGAVTVVTHAATVHAAPAERKNIVTSLF